MADLKNMKGISDADRKMIEQAESLMGTDPSEIGAAKSYFWGNLRSDLLFPYYDIAKESPGGDGRVRPPAGRARGLPQERAPVDPDRSGAVRARVGAQAALRHGRARHDDHQGVRRLGMGITSYNRVLEVIGKYCGSTAVIVSAHQSDRLQGGHALRHRAAEAEWLPKLAREWLSAFCLSEPNVGCDAGGAGNHDRAQRGRRALHHQRREEVGDQRRHQRAVHRHGQADDARREAARLRRRMPSGHGRHRPLLEEPRQVRHRGTWQARITFKNVKVPKWHLLHKEGKGLNVALTCLNYGRCTLSAGMLAAQSVRWTRRSSGARRATSSAARSATSSRSARRSPAWRRTPTPMDAVLYMTTGFLDRATRTSASRPRSARSGAARWAGARSTTPCRSWAARAT